MSRNDLEPRVVRVFPEDLERVLDSLPRTSERTKEWARAFFVEGQTTNEIARLYSVEPQHVGNKIRAIRTKLAEQSSPLQYVEATLSLPIALVQELQALYHDAEVLGSRDLAEQSLQPVLRAVATARKKLREG